MVATVPIKEVNDQKLANASIEIEGEESKDNEITIVVSSYDFEADKDIDPVREGHRARQIHHGKGAGARGPTRRVQRPRPMFRRMISEGKG